MSENIIQMKQVFSFIARVILCELDGSAKLIPSLLELNNGKFPFTEAHCSPLSNGS